MLYAIATGWILWVYMFMTAKIENTPTFRILLALWVILSVIETVLVAIYVTLNVR